MDKNLKSHVHKESVRNTGDPKAWSGMTNRTPARSPPAIEALRLGRDGDGLHRYRPSDPRTP